ncbi:MAG: O-antigen ligase family protein [Anaerolineae bacterium]|nr:O-antigen ligase family protein [Anaerolineae bacterium]
MFLFTSLFFLGKPAQRIFTGGMLCLFVASAVVGMWAAYDSSLSWPVLLSMLFSVSLFVALAYAAISPWGVSRVLVVLAGLFALYFVGQYAHFDYQGEVGLLADLGRMTGSVMPKLVFFIPHPNAAAGFVEGTLLLSLVLTRETRGISRWIWGIITVLIVYALLITGSRGAWLGVVVAVGIWALLAFRERALQLLVAGFGLVVGILGGLYLVMLLASPGRQILFISSALDTAHSRLTLYHNSLQLLKDYPFTGIGLGDTFGMVYSRYQLLMHVPYLYYAHNLFLSVGLGQGLLGVLALVGLILAFYVFVMRVERVGLPKQSLSLYRAAWLGVNVSLVHGLTDAVQFSQAWWTMPMLFALGGLAVATGRPALRLEADTPKNETSRGNRRRYWIGLVVALVVFPALVVVFGRPWLSAWYANLGAVYDTRAFLAPNLNEAARETVAGRAVTYFNQALNLNPVNPVANRRLGMLALERQDFEGARAYLERAYPQEPTNQAVIKALGLAYLWTGQLDAAEARFREVESQSYLLDELNYLVWWWGTQNREDLSIYAGEMAQRLSARQ